MGKYDVLKILFKKGRIRAGNFKINYPLINVDIFNFLLNPLFFSLFGYPYHIPANESSLNKWCVKFKISRLLIGGSRDSAYNTLMVEFFTLLNNQTKD